MSADDIRRRALEKAKQRPLINVVGNDRLDDADWALVSSEHVTLVRGGQPPEVLKGTKLARFKRWILRERAALTRKP